jgi:WhiB family redox-sensing transcriptional regulator
VTTTEPGVTALMPGTRPPAADDWRSRAACRGADPDLFFPLGSNREAIAICAGCPVREDCLDEALEKGDLGIRGGTTETERRLMRAGQRAPIHLTRKTTMPESTQIIEALLDGVTVQEVAETHDWLRDRVLDLINSKPGWRHDPATDTVLVGDGTRGEPVVDLRIEPKTTAEPAPADQDLALGLEELLRRGDHSESAATRAAAKKARAAVEELQERVRTEAAEKQVRDRIAALQKEMETAQAQLRELRPGKATARRSGSAGPTPKEMRAWAASNGITCPAMGRVPQDVVDAYNTAHAPATQENA